MALGTVFVTGSTGLLGNNLVRALVARRVPVKALARSRAKAEAQLGGLEGVEIVVGDVTDVATFAPALIGCTTLFHTAAFFRDSYKGGNHRAALERVNVDGTNALLEAAYAAGIRRMVHTSSIAVLDGRPGVAINETHLRALEAADDYYRSKILAERAVSAFLATHPDFDASFVLPGWMWGPGDVGPTSSGQLALDVVRQKIPGLPPGAFSVVDARDVAEAHIAAAERGRRGERYLAAGHAMAMRDVVPLIGKVAGVPTPKRRIPIAFLFVMAVIQEIYARLTGKPVLIGLATVRLMMNEGERNSNYDLSKSKAELGYSIRPPQETMQDTIAWYRAHAWLT